MGELNPTQRVIDVIKRIEQHHYQLPSIQRPFVWDEDQILKLLDSLICSYPIGAIMVWRPADKIRCRSFIDTFNSGDNLLSQLPAAAERRAYMVLDGQQRLQSLYLSFKGLYNGERVYLRIDCIFRLKADSDSVSIRTPIPVQSGHRFRLIPATFLRGPESEAALDNLHKMGQDASFERRFEWPERGYPCAKYERH